MQVAFVGNFNPPYSTECDIREAFQELGWEVVCLQENQVPFSVLQTAALCSDLLFWVGTWDDLFRLDDILDLRYQLVNKGIPSATLHLDTFWPTKRESRRWWAHSMFQMEHVFTADGDWNGNWRALGVNHYWLPPAVRRSACGLGRHRPGYFERDVALVGSNGRGYHEDVWTYRRELVDHLVEMCERRSWQFLNPGGFDPKIERSGELNDFYATARVCVGDSLCVKREKARYWSDRVPETLGRGGRLIMPQIDALREQWEPALLPMYDWGDWTGLEKLIESELTRPESSVIECKRRACRKVIREHTYVSRVEAILQRVGLS